MYIYLYVNGDICTTLRSDVNFKKFFNIFKKEVWLIAAYTLSLNVKRIKVIDRTPLSPHSLMG